MFPKNRVLQWTTELLRKVHSKTFSRDRRSEGDGLKPANIPKFENSKDPSLSTSCTCKIVNSLLALFRAMFPNSCFVANTKSETAGKSPEFPFPSLHFQIYYSPYSAILYLISLNQQNVSDQSERWDQLEVDFTVLGLGGRRSYKDMANGNPETPEKEELGFKEKHQVEDYWTPDSRRDYAV